MVKGNMSSEEQTVKLAKNCILSNTPAEISLKIREIKLCLNHIQLQQLKMQLKAMSG